MRIASLSFVSVLLSTLAFILGCEKGGTGGSGVLYTVIGLKEPLRAGESRKVVYVIEYLYGTPPQNRKFEATVEFQDRRVSADPAVLRFELSPAGKGEAPFYIRTTKDTKPGDYEFIVRPKHDGGETISPGKYSITVLPE